jgi:tetratricopeptide (TPR) repeat protein
MHRRYLVGPVADRFADEHLGTARRAGTCLAFGSSGVDVPFHPGETWDQLAARLPGGWAPDVLLLNLGYTALPTGFATVPVPVIGYAPDWPLHWHYYHRLAPHVDRLWADIHGCERLAAAGVANTRVVVPFGCPGGLPAVAVDGPRDLDLVWVGNFNAAIHRDRLRWATRVARLGGRYQVRFASVVDPARARPLLTRARVAFLPSFHGAWDSLVGEALTAGAAVVRDAGVPEVSGGLEAGREYVPFADAALEDVLEGLLGDESRRAAVATAGRARAAEFETGALWTRAAAAVDAEWDDLRAAAARRCASSPDPRQWELDHWQFLTIRTPVCVGGDDSDPGARLAAAVRAAWGRRAKGEPVPADVAERLRELLPDLAVTVPAAVQLAELLVEIGRPSEAAPVLRSLLVALDAPGALSPLALGAGCLRPGFHALRVEWERAGWANAGDPVAELGAKRALLRSRAELLLGRATDDPARIVRAARIAPDYCPAVRAAASAAARIGATADAVTLFERAVSDDPFDAGLASEYAEALRQTGDAARAERLEADCRFLDTARPTPSPAPRRGPAAIPTTAAPVPRTRVLSLPPAEFAARFGTPDTSRALSGFTPTRDTHAVLALVAHLRPRRVLEIGTAAGHMTANLCTWTPPNALVFSLGVVREDRPASGAAEQGGEVPARADFARHANHFGTAHKALFITADSRTYDFARLAPLDFVFIDGGHDLETVRSDSRGACAALRPGGCLVWHDFDSRVAWVKVREAVESLAFAEPVYHVAGTEVAFLVKGERVAPAPLPAGPARRQRVSLTMIVRDEEANIAECLDSVRDLVDEIIVVDTGSTDRTPELAVARGARVVPFAWRDDFAAARNAGLDAATGDWIFWLDADERLGPVNRGRARRLFAGLRDENAAYMMRQLSPSSDATGATTAVDQLRLFRNRTDVRWEYRIHEQILLSVRRTGATVRPTDVVIDHRGYYDASTRDRKLRRNTRLLELAHRERPDDPILAFNLAWVYQKAGRPEEALPLLELCRRRLAPSVSIVPKVYRLLGQVLGRLGRTDDALAAFADGRRLYPDDVELLLHHGLLLQRLKDSPAAEGCFRAILSLPEGNYPVGLDLGLRGFKTRHALAELLRDQGRLAEAEHQWRSALAEQPGFGPGWVGLAGVLLATGRPREAAEALDRLPPTDPHTRAAADRLRRSILSTPTVAPT